MGSRKKNMLDDNSKVRTQLDEKHPETCGEWDYLPLNNGLLSFSFALDMLYFFLKFFYCFFFNQIFFPGVNLTKISHFSINFFSKNFVSQNWKKYTLDILLEKEKEKTIIYLTYCPNRSLEHLIHPPLNVHQA